MNNRERYYEKRHKLQNERLEKESNRRKIAVVAIGVAALTAATGYGMHKTMELEKPSAPSTSEQSTTIGEHSVLVENPDELAPAVEIDVTHLVNQPAPPVYEFQE